MKKILIVIPAYNEEKRLAKVITGIPRILKSRKISFQTQVVVIDDGSTDQTYAVAKKCHATVLRHVMNCGAGAATRTGLRYAERHSRDVAYVITIDADGQHATEDIVKLINHAEGHNSDMVVGNRLHAANRKDIPAHRTLGNLGLGLISRLLFGVKIRDTQSGFRLYRASILTSISDYTIDRFGFCTEMLWHANRRGIYVEEAPISIKYTSETLSKGQSNWGVVDLLLQLIWIRISE